MNRVGRNNPCPCGSGKKYKRCCMTRKPRSYEVYIGHKEKFSEIKRDDKGKVLIKTLTGQYVEPDSVFSQTTYKRESGKDKILNLTPDIAVGNYLLELARNFDGVWAIDTNTKIIEGESISVSAIMEAYFNETDVATKVNLRFRQNGFFLFKNCPANLEEKIAWIKMIRIISSLSSYNNNKRIAIITDHDLVKHTSINNHDEPILQSIYLPENFILIYASTDAGKENILNQLLTPCEKAAEGLLKSLEEKSFCVCNGVKILQNNIPQCDEKFCCLICLPKNWQTS